jgi:hypothetical protein
MQTARLNTRQATLSLTPAYENSRHVEGGDPESMMEMDPSFVMNTFKSPIAQEKLHAYRTEYTKGYTIAAPEKHT